MNVLSLFSGIGGIDLAFKRQGHRTVAYVELDPYCRAVLLSRMADGGMDRAPVWGDVRTFDGAPWAERVDCVAGGFPCQDVSVAGKRAGLAGARSGLWSEFARIVREIRPRHVFVENVPGLLSRGMGEVLGDLAALGFDARWGVLSASDVGAPHRRERVWIVADHDGWRRRADVAGGNDARGSDAGRAQADSVLGAVRQAGGEGAVADASWDGRGPRRQGDAAQSSGGRESSRGGIGAHLPDADERRRESERGAGVLNGERTAQRDDSDGCDSPLPDPRRELLEGRRTGSTEGPAQWLPEPDVGRVAHGVPNRVDRLRALGNAVVPQAAEEVIRQWQPQRGSNREA